MTTTELLLFAGFWIICGIAAGMIARSRHRKMTWGFWLGVILGPIGIAIVLLEQPLPANRCQSTSPLGVQCVLPDGHEGTHSPE